MVHLSIVQYFNFVNWTPIWYKNNRQVQMYNLRTKTISILDKCWNLIVAWKLYRVYWTGGGWIIFIVDLYINNHFIIPCSSVLIHPVIKYYNYIKWQYCQQFICCDIPKVIFNNNHCSRIFEMRNGVGQWIGHIDFINCIIMGERLIELRNWLFLSMGKMNYMGEI